jgi:hypothetical protein
MNPGGQDAGESDPRTTVEQAEHIGALRVRIEFLAERERELVTALRQAQGELATHKQKGRGLTDAAIRNRDERLVALEDQLRAANQTIQMMQSTRVWRLGQRYWEARAALKRMLRVS